MVDAREKYRELAGLSEEIARCGRCGFCQSVCPIYHVSAKESGVARGKNMYARELLSGGLDLSANDKNFLSECLLCRACVETCFSQVKTDEIVLAGRRSQRRLLGISPLYRYIFRYLLPDHRKLGRLLRVASKGRAAGFDRMLDALRIFGWTGSRFERATHFSREIPKQFLRERLANRASPVQTRKRAVLFIGCGTNFMLPHVGEATISLLELLGYEVAIAENGCCGLPAFVHGELTAARQLAANNMLAFAGTPDDIIVTDCSSCASYLKTYPQLFPETDGSDEETRTRAELFASRTHDITEILASEEAGRLIEHATAGRTRPYSRVTFHDPCHLSRYLKLSSQARRVLDLLPGTEFIEMKEADWCCGGAGTFAVEHPHLSLRILERKMRNIDATGADAVVTTCPSCIMQIRFGLQPSVRTAPESGKRIVHLVEIVRERLAAD
jgi:glycolate oxidase iron-sulfur subunit